MGDELLSIEDRPIADLFDYHLATGGRRAVFTLLRDGAQVMIAVRKAPEEPMGIEFDGQLLGPLRRCRNRCIFCFADQLPRGVRSSLRVKDDDWRHSALLGNYVTLTNVTCEELLRIIDLRIGPLYVSVHATDPQVRASMLSIASDPLPGQLDLLCQGGIGFHAQIVLCPGHNDGEILERSIDDLAARHPSAISLAVVPVGLTAHREGLPRLASVDESAASAALEIIERAQRRLLPELGTRFVFASDELYLRAGRPLPAYEDYEDFPQIGNGVGMLAQLERELFEAAEEEPITPRPRSVALVTGVSAAPFLQKWIVRLPLPGAPVTVIPAANDFFGPSVTVAGLVTGSDILRALREHVGQFDEVLFPDVMLRDGEAVFLDDTTPQEIARDLGLPLRAVGCSGTGLWRGLCGL